MALGTAHNPLNLHRIYRLRFGPQRMGAVRYMRQFASLLWLLWLLLAISWLPGCGGGSQISPMNPTPTPPTAATAYDVSLFPTASVGPAVGQVSVDTNGKVTLQLTGATANTTFSLQFCPAPAQNYTCLNIGPVSSDSGGKANTSMQFPSSGSWAGDFQLLVNGTAQYSTNVPSGTNTGVYSASLQPQATTNGKGTFLTGTPPAQGPLASGTAKLANGMLQVQMTGALPNTFYGGGECPLFFGSSCYTLYDTNNTSGFKTDGNGNLSFTVQLDGVTGDIFTVDTQGNSDAGYIAGFKVP